MKKIMVIDDVAENRDIFTTLLEDQYQVIEAADGRQGLELAEKEIPDLMFLDVSMPGMSGLEFIECLRRHSDLYHIPVIAITAHSVFSAKKAVVKGCNDYLLKPLTPKKILQKIEEWIEQP
jgi:two-component system cell cycle response regulator DivK